MLKALLNRFPTSQFATLMLIAAITTLSGCNSCHTNSTTVPEDERTLNVLHAVGSDCIFQPANGQQSIFIEVKGTSTNNLGNTWTNNLQSVAAGTYPVKVPSQGTYKITVTATETNGTSTCQPCTSACGVVNTYPKWKGSDNFTAPTNTLNVTITIPSSPSKVECGC